MLIDSHFHPLIMQEKGMDLALLFDKMLEEKMQYALAIATHPAELKEIKELCKGQSHIYYASGIYPSYCTEDITDPIDKLKKQIDTEDIIAIGEIGLDYYHSYGTREKQKALFVSQLEIAKEYDKPIILHIRESFDDVISCLKEIRPSSRGIAHCFSGNINQAKKLMDMGFYISFAGNITYKKNTELVDTLRQIPLDRLLIETDSPFLSPVPVRGKPNTPLNTSYILDFISDKLGISRERLTKIIIDNFKNLFKL